jgi:cytochrome P450
MLEKTTATCLFSAAVRGLDEPDPARSALGAAGPIVRAEAPAGGPVWIVTDEQLARAVLADPRISKDTALAPRDWDPRAAGLEPTAAEQPALTTLEGEAHTRLRQAHAPLFSARRMAASYDRMTAIARELLAAIADQPVDLTADFSTRYPVTVLCDLLGVPLDHVDVAVAACRGCTATIPPRSGRPWPPSPSSPPQRCTEATGLRRSWPSVCPPAPAARTSITSSSRCCSRVSSQRTRHWASSSHDCSPSQPAR